MNDQSMNGSIKSVTPRQVKDSLPGLPCTTYPLKRKATCRDVSISSIVTVITSGSRRPTVANWVVPELSRLLLN